MDFTSFELFSVAYLELYLAKKFETQQIWKQTVKHLPRRQEIHSSHDHEIRHHVITFFESVTETNGRATP